MYLFYSEKSLDEGDKFLFTEFHQFGNMGRSLWQTHGSCEAGTGLLIN